LGIKEKINDIFLELYYKPTSYFYVCQGNNKHQHYVKKSKHKTIKAKCIYNMYSKIKLMKLQALC